MEAILDLLIYLADQQVSIFCDQLLWNWTNFTDLSLAVLKYRCKYYVEKYRHSNQTKLKAEKSGIWKPNIFYDKSSDSYQ